MNHTNYTFTDELHKLQSSVLYNFLCSQFT